ncbi:SLM2 [Candida margitis]|uniref:SLM2 n=1 Tax=Candida margitis TaxID=1775924 RepID=UPI0022273D77|nr:SLM2 [Candida margitis]KAI5970026.1 SLM2 [Candida margitis]
MPYDMHNPLTVALPYNFMSNNDYPTEVMANRFVAWRSFIKELLNYFREYSSVQEEIVRQQARLQQAVGATVKSIASPSATNHSSNIGNQDIEAITKSFLPIGNGSVQDVPDILFHYHQQNVTNSSKTLKEINAIIIPKLEELRKDLLVKIKEIKNLQNDFKNNLNKELNETKSLISQYNQAVEWANKLDTSHNLHQADAEQGKYDPFLVKTKLDRQLKRQLVEENYLYDAYSNLQNAGKQLESIVVAEIQNYLSSFLKLIREENLTFTNYLEPNIINGFLSKETNFEWNAFIERNLPSNNLSVSAVGNQTTSSVKNGTFIDLDIPKRHLSDLIIRNAESNLNVAVREGYLERRSKFLKNYSSAWYVLTCSFIHEFKSNDRKKDPHPVMSLPLDSCTVSDHSKDDGKANGVYKFILTSKSASALMHKTHKWVFRTNTYQDMIDWFSDIKKLTSLPTPISRARTLPNRPKGVVSAAKAGSRASSIRSPTRSLRTVNTNTSNLQKTNSRNSHRPLSQTTSIANANRLSSTFSSRNNQSPRLSNMINSDGTIITPVETDDNVKRNPSFISHSGYESANRDPAMQQQQQNYVPLPQTNYQQQMHQQPYQLIPVESITSGGHSQQGQQFANIGTPSSSVPYYIQSGGQPQQFYDPVQQQYYTITPSAPISQQQSQNGQQGAPQPQFFPTSPRGAPVSILSTSPAAQPFGSAYFSQFAGAGVQQQAPSQAQSQQVQSQQSQPPSQAHSHQSQPQSQAQSQQGQPSQKNIHPMYLNGDLNQQDDHTKGATATNGPTQNGEASLHPNMQRHFSADEVSTLKSGPIEQSQPPAPNANGDINIIVSDDK